MSAGLTLEQATALQSTADRYLAALGGRQVAANQIDLNGKGLLTIALPGEKKARGIGNHAAVRSADDPCLGGAFPGYFCAYSMAWGDGDSLAMFMCSEYVLPGWTGLGSWDNNQTTGTQAQMRGRGGKVLFTTPGAYSNQMTGFDWNPVWGVSPC
ncbi:hypothetical protein [Amycolatopsis sp. GA6-003]|uniref:hypothetical protein n=1 Tax=Amycolatopsis sp. GA6-003 TaxID=2652444 RepID=UPI0039173F62